MTESALIEASKSGDSEAFGKLIQRYEDKIFRLAHNVCAGLPAEAEDIYQETFITAFEKIDRFRKDSQLGTWQALPRLYPQPAPDGPGAPPAGTVQALERHARPLAPPAAILQKISSVP